MAAKHRILVLGAAGVVGPSLLRLLAAQGHQLCAVSRRDQGPTPSTRWLRGDLDGDLPLPGGIDAAVHAAPLWLLPGHLQRLADTGVRRLLAFSSTSAVSKLESSAAGERALAQRLTTAENACRDLCQRSGLTLTLFRPTMIYGYRRDQNIMTIARFIRRFGFFPIAGTARGRRQPVHADDLARACVASLDATATYGRDYVLSGGETLSYRDMVRRIFTGMGRRPRVLSLPLPVYRTALGLLNRVVTDGRYSPAMAARMQQDLCFEHAEARSDFGYAPSSFLADPRRDLPVD